MQGSYSAPTYKVKNFPALEQRVGGTWRVHWNEATGTPDLIYGTGLALRDWRGNSEAEARRQAQKALAEYGDLLLLGSSEYRETIGAPMGNAWAFTFDQYYRGLPCVGGRAQVQINKIGVIAMLGSSAWQIPDAFNVVPAVDQVEAEARAWLALDQVRSTVKQPGMPRATQLVIWGDMEVANSPIALAWEVPISNVDADGRGPVGRYYIDAANGSVLHYTNDKHECSHTGCSDPSHVHAPIGPMAPAAITPTTVTVMAWTRTGQSAIAPLVNVPAVGLVVNVPGIGAVTTDSNGQFTIDITAPVTITVSQIDGRHNAPMNDVTASFPAASVTVNPGVAATLQILSSAATQNQATHMATQYWIDTANEWVRTIVGNSAQMNTADNVVPSVNVSGTCNAFYTGNTVNFYPNGGGCNNTGFSTVVVHEWGHGIDDRYGGVFNLTAEGLSEGWGDIFGMYHPLVDNPVVGIDFTTTGGFVRTGLNGTLWHTQTEVHAAGEVWMGFAWRLRDNLRAAFGTPTAISISNTIVVGTIVANATDQVGAVNAVFVADDNDGNLLNGVPHYAQLAAAATTKNIPFPVFQPITIQHVALADTTVRYTPRAITANLTTNDGGTITSASVTYSVAGGPAVTRPMVITGSPNGYRALLPGVDSGAVAYHINASSTTGSQRLPLTGEFTYSTVTGGPFTAIFSENFEGAATGWTHTRVSGVSTDDWQLGVPNGKSGTSIGVAWIDPSAANSSRVYGTDLGAGTSNGAYPANMVYYLRSPIINCTGATGVSLRFRRWLSVEESLFDHAQINVNGTLVWENPVSGNTTDTAWSTVEYPLPMADNNPSVQIEFRLITDGGLQLGGWNIDDVEVGFHTPAPINAILRVLPEQATSGTPLTVAVETDQPNEFFALVYSPFQGSTTIAPFPTVDVGSPFDVLLGTTNALRLATFGVNAPTGLPATGMFVFSQLLVFESDGSYTLSNDCLSLFTP